MNPFVRRLDRLHDLFLYISLGLAFLATLFGGALGPVMAALFPAGALLAPLLRRRVPALTRQNVVWNALIIGVLFYTGVEYLSDPLADVIGLGIRFVLVLVLIKLFSRQGPRDELQLHALSLLTFAAASAANEGLSFGVLFGAYILSGTFTLALFHLKTESARRPSLSPPRRSPFDRFYVMVLAAISLAIFASSLAIFFTFPRVGLGLFVTQTRESVSVAGFSEDVALGSHGLMRSNPAVVMRVEFPEDPRPADTDTLRWRAMTFDAYDGQRWSRTHSQSERPAPYSSQAHYDLAFLRTAALDELLSGQPARRARIYLEPLGTNILPSLWPPATLALGPGEGLPRIGSRAASLTRDNYGDLRHTMDSELGLTYTLGFYEPPPESALLRHRGRSLNEQETRRYTRVPIDLDPRVTELAADLSAGERTPYAKARAIASYFQREFTYTTDLPQVDPEQPVASFLFETRAGHCEYFATSAALMLRTQGVPTRLVNGFLGGTWNELGNYLTVRQGDAHAWIEIFVPELGWVPVEATPAIESGFADRSPVARWGSDAYDAMRQAWLKWVLEYDLQAQIVVIRRAARTLSPRGTPAPSRSDEARANPRESIPLRDLLFGLGWIFLLASATWQGATRQPGSGPRRAIVLAIWGGAGALWVSWFLGWSWSHALLGALSVGAARALSPMLGASPAARAQHQVTHHFLAIEQAATRHGLARHNDEGPRSYLERVASQLDARGREHVEHFLRRYLALRFGGKPYGPHQAREMRRLTRAVITALKRSARR
ncbi:hypothetical protein DL240_12680 [Lujinxingia litoralis]|uniref:Transglutaminase-like domain-containing protein n=1 Tax=Lujinxingia litoralis TaxID=2211119 RepID=A0A328C6F0_9DELT|nr:DUF3488 and DUF4129 domain-containing transglutaminase family protein [Lujinxingia litoralis]RAL21703.1 hypothetical protein DL240_12680 [Lujinxingia litoralis]